MRPTLPVHDSGVDVGAKWFFGLTMSGTCGTLGEPFSEGSESALGALWSKLPRGVRYSRSKSVSGHDRSKYALVGWYNRKYANQFLPATVGIQFDS